MIPLLSKYFIFRFQKIAIKSLHLFGFMINSSIYCCFYFVLMKNWLVDYNKTKCIQNNKRIITNYNKKHRKGILYTISSFHFNVLFWGWIYFTFWYFRFFFRFIFSYFLYHSITLIKIQLKRDHSQEVVRKRKNSSWPNESFWKCVFRNGNVDIMCICVCVWKRKSKMKMSHNYWQYLLKMKSGSNVD